MDRKRKIVQMDIKIVTIGKKNSSNEQENPFLIDI